MRSLIKRSILSGIRVAGAAVTTPLNARFRRAAGLSRPTRRTDFLRQVPLASALEIGPFDKPIIVGPGVSYFDVMDSAALRSRAAVFGYDATRIPKRIDFVSATGDLTVVDRQFDAVVSSHAVEHQPDLIRHLQEVGRLLTPGGRYYLIVPDRRFTFDHYLNETSVPDVERAHREQRRIHTREAIFDHRVRTTHNNPLRHWFGWHGRPKETDHARRVAEDEALRAEAGEYIDVHAWAFSPAGFLAIVTELHRRGAIGLRVERVHDTGFADLEFFAVLKFGD